MITPTNVRVDVYNVGDDDPVVSIPKKHVEHAELTERLGDRIHTGRFTINNDRGDYTGDIRSGTRLEFWAEFSVDTIDHWGDATWGDKVWGGERRIWSAMVRDWENDEINTRRMHLNADCVDFAFGLLEKRDVYLFFDQKSPQEIIQGIVNEAAEEISVYVDPAVTGSFTVRYEGENAFEAINDILVETDAIAQSYGDAIRVVPHQRPEWQFEVADDDIGLLTVDETDDGLANDIRVNGPRGNAIDAATSRQSVSRIRHLTESDRIAFQIRTRKSEVSQIDLYTQRRSEDELSIRLQKDDDGRPVDVDDPGSDIAQNRQEYHFVSENDWCTFEFKEHTLPEPDPWVIIETNGPDGHGIGVTADGEISRRVFYPFDIAVTDYDAESIAQFRRRQTSVNASNASVGEARSIASRAVSRHAWPEQTVETEGYSRRMHTMRPGELIEFDNDRVGAVGDYLLTERTDVYDSSEVRLQSEFSFRQV